MSPAGLLPRDPRTHRRVRSSVRAGLVWAVGAAAVNVLLWLFATVAGVEFAVWPSADSSEPVTLGPLIIILATLFPGLLAGIAVGFLGKLVQKVVRWIVVAGVIVTVASLAAPLGQPAQVTGGAEGTLVAMHLVTGVLVTFGLARGIWTDDRAGTK